MRVYLSFTFLLIIKKKVFGTIESHHKYSLQRFQDNKRFNSKIKIKINEYVNCQCYNPEMALDN